VPHVVIIGGGFGGLSAAKALRKAPVSVTIIDRHNHHLFQPLLYQVATATLSPGDIASPIRWILRKARNTRVLLGEVRAIDLAARRVTLEDGSFAEYDYLILATGTSHTYFGHDDWAPYAPALKTLEDALTIRRRILVAFEHAERETDAGRQQRLLTFVLVGGGPTGVELAGTLAEIARQTRSEFRNIDTRATRIVLVEAGPTILPSFAPKLRDAARRSLERLRVEVREQTRVTGVDADGVTLAPMHADGVAVVAERLDAGTVLWTAGVAASPLTATLGVERDRAGRVVVTRDLSIPGHPEAFVIGDASAFLDRAGHPLPGVAQVAMQGGAHAARTILHRLEGQPSQEFVYSDRGNMAIIGRGSAIADIRGLRFSGLLAWLAWLFLHIFELIGFRNRLVVMIEWAAAYITLQRSVRLITYQQSDRP
jgi:NADH dehydrogenase